MVKFSKQLEGQLVPEWRPAYVNYKILKKELKHIKLQPRRSLSDGMSHSFRAAMSFGGWMEKDSGQASTSVAPSPPLRHIARAKESFDSLVALGGHAAHALRSKSQRRRGGARACDVIEVRFRTISNFSGFEIDARTTEVHVLSILASRFRMDTKRASEFGFPQWNPQEFSQHFGFS
ncbi:hypothetical protein Mapa_012498 [Marchantia paleacea]|nr:hypothetical protein Mapa_012498 [Marchantia paleacea]